jgi:hypothetical protein
METNVNSTTISTKVAEEGAVQRLNRDLRVAAESLTPAQARFLVDAYYTSQDNRIREQHQIRSLGTNKEPHACIDWLQIQNGVMEEQLKAALDRFSLAQPIGIWMRKVVGVGPVIAAGLIAHIDITKAPTVSHIWRFGGYDPTLVWEKGQKRPFNADLKLIFWKLGQSFMKQSGNEASLYGHKLYRGRKAFEIARNDDGAMAETAAAILEKRKYRKETDAFKWLSGRYKGGTMAAMMKLDPEARPAFLKKRIGEVGEFDGMLPPAQIDGRARRYAVKLFLSHAHVAWRRLEGLTEPTPFAMAHLEHHDMIDPEVPYPPTR